MEQRDAIHMGRLPEDERQVIPQAVGVGDDVQLDRGFQPLGKGEGTDRQGGIGKLQQAREATHIGADRLRRELHRGLTCPCPCACTWPLP